MSKVEQLRTLAQKALDALAEEQVPEVRVAPPPKVRVSVYAAISGLTESAIRKKIDSGTWLERREYFRAPDGTIWISIQGVDKWVEAKA